MPSNLDPHAGGLLRFYPRPDRRTYHPLTADSVCFGRSAACEVPISSDLVSRRHALLERLRGGWRIRDLGSTNGVFVNGEQVKSRQLADGVLIRIGSAIFRLMLTGPPKSGAGDDPCAVESEGLVGGIALAPLRAALKRAAAEGTPVLLVGEAGVGKAAAAKQLYELQGAGPGGGSFVELDCAAPDSATPQSAELRRQVVGALQECRTAGAGDRGGTLFLRRVEALAADGQTWLAEALAGAQVQLVASARSSAELDPALRARLAGVGELRVPPLRERPEDIPLLVQRLMEPAVTVEAMEQLCCQTWPRNAQGLEEMVREALDRTQEGERLDLEHLKLGTAGHGQPAARATAVVQELEQALRRHGGDVNAAAAEIGISRSQLYRRAKTHGVRVGAFRKGS